ncbi:hypothetical protein NL676_038832 [Syzygium grande]|nr:hypothetical protein NL676_038832 [Syzygium grande]
MGVHQHDLRRYPQGYVLHVQLWDIEKTKETYGQSKAPIYNMTNIPKTLPLWIGHVGSDTLADLADAQCSVDEMQSRPQMLYLENYAHIDFLLSLIAKKDVYDPVMGFFRSLGKQSSSS